MAAVFHAHSGQTTGASITPNNTDINGIMTTNENSENNTYNELKKTFPKISRLKNLK